ncbi:MAG: orotate phosphoribosyltransferase [Candidatus Lokiarchaeota archaeon]|nr:orotate phosphoribosyltransferase [Candidatus Lokiarchaeota archaeon]
MSNEKEIKLDLIEFIIKKKGLLFGNFELKSKRISPYFFNLANIIIDGEGISKISKVYAEYLYKEIGVDNFDFIFGPAYKGIPLSAAISLQLKNSYNINKRWGYDRKEPKNYGDTKEKWLVGDFHDNDKIIMVDDVVTTGLTKIEAREKIKNYSKTVNLQFTGVLILLDRQEKNINGKLVSEYLKDFKLPLYSILKINNVFNLLRNHKINGNIIIDSEKYEKFKTYFKKYGI